MGNGLASGLTVTAGDIRWKVKIFLLIRTQVLKAYFGVSYSSWAESRVGLIPNPGKEPYTNTKAYRPICLVSLMFKAIVELIVNDRVTSDLLKSRNHATIKG